MSKRILSLVLALVMVLGTFGTVFAAETENAKVAKLVELGLVTGDEGGLRLADPIRRSEVAAMVVRAAGLEAIAKASTTFASPFKDMNAAHWANGYVNVAAGRGYVNGYPDGSFVPENNITYAEVAAMLVRVLGGLTEAEAKAAKWPTTYLAKALELGILKDVAIANFEEVAQREFVFEMVYNTITAKGSNLVVANTIEGIVVENYRTETLAKDEVVVHVMKDQVQRTDGKYYEAGDEYKLVITEELADKGFDAEYLLGKVVTVSFDKEGKVVGLEINNDYTYLQGELSRVTTKSLRLDGKSYTVLKEEGRFAEDERLYQVYYNNRDYSYDEGGREDFVDVVAEEDTLEFAKITVRNGKVFFIDAFANFTDIAPVAKDIDSRNRVAYYDDSNFGEVNTLTVGNAAYVINVVDGEVRLGSNKDIAANDVIHWLTTEDKDLVVFVRPFEDAVVEGEFIEAKAGRYTDAADVYLKVEDTSYPAYVDNANRNMVYSYYASEGEFDVLEDDRYFSELEVFEKEEVVVLLDMFGNVQSISTETEILASAYALISDVWGTEFRLLLADNTKDWFDTDRATKLTGNDDSRENRLVDYNIGELVKAYADEDNLLSELRLFRTTDEDVLTGITAVTNSAVDFGESFKFVNKNTVVFINYPAGKEVAMTVANFVKNYNQSAELNGYVVLAPRDKELAEAIVITAGATLKDTAADGDVVYGKVDYVGRNFLELQGNETRFSATSTQLSGLVRGDIVAVLLEKGSETKVRRIYDPFVEFDEVLYTVEYITVKSTSKGRIQATNGEEYRVEDAVAFDTYKVGTKLVVVVNKYNNVAFLKVGEIDDAAIAKVVEDMFLALPDAGDVTLEDEEAINAAVAAYAALTQAQKDLVSQAAKDHANAAVASLQELQA